MKKVVKDYWLEDVEFEVTLRPGKADSSGGAVDLHADHRHGFALCRIHLAGHDRRSRFVFRDLQFTQATARTGSQPADVVGNLHQRSGQCFQSALSEYNLIMR